MSLSVNGSNTNNPFAWWQSLQQQGTSASGSAQSDPLASLLAALGQGQGTATGASTTPGGSSSSSSSTSGTTTSGGSSPQFGSETLQTLFDMQANASTSQSLASQLDGGGPDGSSSSQQSQQGDATSQTTANSNGSSTTTITYADGSTVSLTTAAASDSSGSSTSSTASPAGGANAANNNLLERLIQMQAQLINPTTTQNIATA